MLHRAHLPDGFLTDGVSSTQAMDALLHDLGQARARKQPPGRPFVTLAYAQSLDGSISIARGQRSALSGPESLRFTHALRARHDGILVGVGTVLADDPELRVRLVDGRDPQPVIVDSQLSTPIEAKLLGRGSWIGTTHATPTNRRAGVEARGARILSCDPLPNGWVDLAALLRQLHDAGIQHLMVEGGARIITSFLEARLVDYVALTIAPMFLGGLPAVGRLSRPAAPTASTAVFGPALGRWVSARLGHDLVLSGEVSWPAD
jgi:3,4-dihydroxy 2-butanone 4-phosphate synthase/GTP cyclohydrolase II